MTARFWLLPLLALSLVAAPRPKTARGVVVRSSLCPATGTCRVILTWTRPSNYTAATDTAHTLWIRSPAETLKQGTPPSTADTLLVPRPADGLTSNGTVRLCYTRKGWTGQACNAPLAWAVTAPVGPVDTATTVKVTGIIVKPDSFRVVATVAGVSVSAKNQQQMCAFPAFASGHVGFRRTTEGTSPVCDSLYRALPASVRALSAAEQAVADTVCVHWSATGGTISTEPCSGVPG